MATKPSQELILWQDINKQLVDLVMQVLKSKPEEMNEQAVQAMVEPYLKQIEQDVENRLRQTREDEQAREKEKNEKIWSDKAYANLQDKLQQYANLKIGKYTSTCHPKSIWVNLLPSLGNILPGFSEVKIIRTPAQFNSVPNVKSLRYKNGFEPDLECYRSTIEVQGVDPIYRKQLARCKTWDDVINLLVSTGVPLSPETTAELCALEYTHNTASKGLLAAQELLSKRHIRPVEFLRFFTESKTGGYRAIAIGTLGELLQSTSAGNISRTRRLELLQRKPLTRKQQE